MTLSKSAVLIPGWATDSRIFDSLVLPFDKVLAADFSCSGFDKELLALLKKGSVKKTTLIGYSLGGFLAADFACKYPDLIDNLILVSIRQQYPPRTLDAIKKYLIENKKAYLYKFYHECFYSPEDMSWFKKNLLKRYLSDMPAERLLTGLDYLKKARIKASSVKNIKIIHGEFDKIAPLKEAQGIARELKVEFIVVKDAGHMLFLKKGFDKIL
ncbi:MAG: alpha/beta hydrolase [Candidatus Omnitrophica bacterium]|nr:alpha/beta hydrolase [Candidatus Omnitrophota bacterium]